MLYSKELKVFSNTDVVVCGGGFSGFASAYACAREGVKVVLVEKLGA